VSSILFAVRHWATRFGTKCGMWRVFQYIGHAESSSFYLRRRR